MKYYHKYLLNTLKTLKIIMFISVFSISALVPRVAFALTAKQCDQSYLRNIGAVNLSCAIEEKCSVPDSAVSLNLSGNDNPEKIWNFFIQKGLSPQNAAGFLGNIQAESGFNPKLVEYAYSKKPHLSDTLPPIQNSKTGQPGYGLIQWTYPTRRDKLQEKVNNDPQKRIAGDLSLQLELIWEELNGGFKKSTLDPLKNAKTASESSIIITKNYEVPGDAATQTPKRAAAAEEFFKKYSSLGQGVPIPGGAAVAPSTSAECGAGISGPGDNTKFIDGFTVYSQYDPAWRNLPYSSSTIGESGCGPSAMAMIITNLTGKSVKPTETANYAASKQIYIPGSGSAWNIAPVLAQNWGLKATPIGKDLAKITQTLQAGGLVITSGKGPVPFSKGGHYIVIRAVTASGKLLVGDSAHEAANTQEWDPQQILSAMPGGSTYAITK